MTMKSNPELWARLDALSLDDVDAAFPFSARLARDNGWSLAFSKRVIKEYKCFCYLAMTAGHEVTPSDEVDQVWHLHLTYTRHYWGEFTEALGANLHHGPTSGGPAEENRYRDNYEATLQSYMREFFCRSAERHLASIRKAIWRSAILSAPKHQRCLHHSQAFCFCRHRSDFYPSPVGEFSCWRQ